MIDEKSVDLHTLEKEELDLKTDHRTLVKAKIEEISVLAKTIEEKKIRVRTLAVEVEKTKSELIEAEMTSLADGELASTLTGTCNTIKLLNDDSFKHPLPETPQVGEQLTSERKCLGFGDIPGHPGGDQETSRDTAGSPRNARAKQVWMRLEGRSRAMDLRQKKYWKGGSEDGWMWTQRRGCT